MSYHFYCPCNNLASRIAVYFFFMVLSLPSWPEKFDEWHSSNTLAPLVFFDYSYKSLEGCSILLLVQIK